MKFRVEHSYQCCLTSMFLHSDKLEYLFYLDDVQRAHLLPVQKCIFLSQGSKLTISGQYLELAQRIMVLTAA